MTTTTTGNGNESAAACASPPGDPPPPGDGPARPGRSPAATAVGHLLDRIQTDPDLAWLLLGTHAHRLLLEAEAAETGEAVEEATLRRMSRRSPPGLQAQAQVLWLRRRVRQLETAVLLLLEAGPPRSPTPTPTPTVAVTLPPTLPPTPAPTPPTSVSGRDPMKWKPDRPLLAF